MTLTQTAAALLTHQPAIAAALLVLALLIIGLAIWILLPRADDREADIERQIQSLRRHADNAVATRPRVRGMKTPVPSLLRIKRLLVVRTAKKTIMYSPGVRASLRRSRRASAALGKAIRAYVRNDRSLARPQKPEACGGGLCRHRADCSDHYCPGRLAASLSTTEQP